MDEILYRGEFASVERDRQYPKTLWIVNKNKELLLNYPFWDLNKANRKAAQMDDEIKKKALPSNG